MKKVCIMPGSLLRKYFLFSLNIIYLYIIMMGLLLYEIQQRLYSDVVEPLDINQYNDVVIFMFLFYNSLFSWKENWCLIR